MKSDFFNDWKYSIPEPNWKELDNRASSVLIFKEINPEIKVKEISQTIKKDLIIRCNQTLEIAMTEMNKTCLRLMNDMVEGKRIRSRRLRAIKNFGNQITKLRDALEKLENQ